MSFEGLFDHAAISISGWLLGTILGMGVSSVLNNVLHRINYGKSSSLLTPFVPWRTLLVGLLLPSLFPITLIRWFGIGLEVGLLSVAYIVFFLTLIIVGQTTQNQSDPTIVQVISRVRTLAVFSIIPTIYFGMWGGGGIGFVLREHAFLFDDRSVWLYYAALFIIALVIDLILAFVQWWVNSYATNKLRQLTENAG